MENRIKYSAPLDAKIKIGDNYYIIHPNDVVSELKNGIVLICSVDDNLMTVRIIKGNRIQTNQIPIMDKSQFEAIGFLIRSTVKSIENI